jgi:hypothetical protein
MFPPLLVLLCWPLVVLYFYKRYDLATALILSIVLGYLFLPHGSGIDLPVLPQFDKVSIPSFAVLVISAMMLSQTGGSGPLTDTVRPGLLPKSPLVLFLLFLIVGGAFMTAVLNRDVISLPTRNLRGLSFYDAFSATMIAMVSAIPMLMGRKYLSTPDAHRKLLTVLAISGLVYAFLSLYEIRMSPQLAKDFYGLTNARWRQHLRGGGFRPTVFLEHGLWLGIYLTCAAISAITLVRAGKAGQKSHYIWIVGILVATILMSKTLGALLIVLMLIPIVLFVSVRSQLLVAASISAVVLLYPVLRSADWIPVEKATELAASISAERAGSLNFRFENEDALLDKAMERPYFGWGGWGRSLIRDDAGSKISVSDGRWVIAFGIGGFVRYIGEFGLLTLPIIALAWRRRKLDITLATSGLCLVLVANQIDLIPNATLTPITWLVTGALVGRLEYQAADDQTEPQSEESECRNNTYGRNGLQPRPERAKQGDRPYSRFPPVTKRSSSE